MKVLIIGGGGREHAMAWKAAQSARVAQVYVAPGNAGTELEPGIENVAIGAEEIPALCRFAQRKAIDLTIVGPEVPLVEGIVDAFQDAGLRCFGPRRLAARLEGSKVFCKRFLERHSIPTAAFASFTDEARACSFIREKGVPIVIKADGLAAGKGVVIAHTEQQAMNAVRDMLSRNVFGNAGHRVVIEEFLQGEEVSFIVMADGEHILPMATSQDHKARDDGDQGPNTGGMGAYSPAPAVTSAVYERIMTEVIEPTLAGMAADGVPYTGFLYAGLMIAPNGTPKVLEYNCRLGDPEAQPILMRLNSDLIDLCQAALDRKLDAVQAEWDRRAALGVVLAAGGYPGSYEKGDVIFGLSEEMRAEEKVFHAGTRLKDGKVVTSGGRVLCVCALGESLVEAQARAYRLARTITWNNIYYRTDIGHRAVGSRDNQSK
jgi:phosphoribosylamine---glycine ligase